MINRDRAWRRRKDRRTDAQKVETEALVARTIDIEKPGPSKGKKQHRHGALTHVQDARLSAALGDELRDVD